MSNHYFKCRNHSKYLPTASLGWAVGTHPNQYSESQFSSTFFLFPWDVQLVYFLTLSTSFREDILVSLFSRRYLYRRLCSVLLENAMQVSRAFVQFTYHRPKFSPPRHGDPILASVDHRTVATISFHLGTDLSRRVGRPTNHAIAQG